MNLKNLKNRAGFTLIELIVVIAIMAILAGVAVPVYSGYIEKAEKAADLQLLDAVNSAFAAACYENDEYDLEALKNIPSIGTYNPTVTINHEYAEEFNKYFEGNNTGFEYFDGSAGKWLKFVKGRFVDPTTNPEGVTAVTYGGATIYMSEEDIQNLKNSTFLNAATLNGSSGLLDQVNLVTGIATGMADGALSTVFSDPDFTASAMAALGITTEAEYQAKQKEMVATMMANGMSEQDAYYQLAANAAVLYAAKNATQFTTSDVNKLFSETGVDEIKSNLKTTGNTTTGMAQAALIYGMYTAYANSEEYGNETLQSNTGNALTVLNALEDDSDFKNYVNSAAGQQDLAAYMSAMGIITDSAASDPAAVEHLMINGFNNSELKGVVAELTGK